MRNWQTKKLNELLTQRKEQVIILPDDEYALVTISNKNMCFPDSIVGVQPKKTCQETISLCCYSIINLMYVNYLIKWLDSQTLSSRH